MSAPAATSSAATAASSSSTTAKRKHDELTTHTPNTNPNAMSDHDFISSSMTSDESLSKRAKLSVTPMTPVELASLLSSTTTRERVCIRSEILVSTTGEANVFLNIYTPTPASKQAAKEAKYQASKAVFAQKRVEKKQKQKEKKAELREKREQLEQQWKAEGKTQEEIKALRNEFYENAEAGTAAAPSSAASSSPVTTAASSSSSSTPHVPSSKRHGREGQALKQQILSTMRSHTLQRIILDCSFDSLMQPQEIFSLAKQVKFMYGQNVRSTKPVHMILTSLDLIGEDKQTKRNGKTGALMATATSPAPTAAVVIPEGTTEHGDILKQDVRAREEMRKNGTSSASTTNTTSSATAAPVPMEMDESNATTSSTSASTSTPASSAVATSSSTTVATSLTSTSSSTSAPPVSTRSILQRIDGFERLIFDRTILHYSTIFPQSSLVYLTAESSTVLHELNPSDVYIIGGIVDHNRMKGLCHNLATSVGLRTARLPIPEFLVHDKRTVITVNQVFEILVKVGEPEHKLKDSGKVDWLKVFQTVLPQRSNWQARGKKQKGNEQAAEEEDEEQQEMKEDEAMEE